MSPVPRGVFAPGRLGRIPRAQDISVPGQTSPAGIACVRSTAAGRDRRNWNQTPLGELRTNKKVTEVRCVCKTRAAFQSGQHNRWLAAGRAVEVPAPKYPQRETELAKDPPRQKTPLGRKTPHPGWAGRYSLVSSRNDRGGVPSQELRNRSAEDYTPRGSVRQGRDASEAKRKKGRVPHSRCDPAMKPACIDGPVASIRSSPLVPATALPSAGTGGFIPAAEHVIGTQLDGRAVGLGSLQREPLPCLAFRHSTSCRRRTRVSSARGVRESAPTAGGAGRKK